MSAALVSEPVIFAIVFPRTDCLPNTAVKVRNTTQSRLNVRRRHLQAPSRLVSFHRLFGGTSRTRGGPAVPPPARSGGQCAARWGKECRVTAETPWAAVSCRLPPRRFGDAFDDQPEPQRHFESEHWQVHERGDRAAEDSYELQRKGHDEQD